MQTQTGSGKATLRKEPKDITLLDIFKAVEETGLLKREFDTCPRCNIATSLKTAADETFSRIENAAFEEMKKNLPAGGSGQNGTPENDGHYVRSAFSVVF